MSRSITYSTADVSFVFNGVAVTDFAEDDTIEVEYPEDASSVTQGTDSASTSFARKTTGKITVYVRPTSSFLDLVYNRYFDQVNGAGSTVTATLRTGVQENFTFEGVSISSPGNPTEGGEKMVKRAIGFNFESWSPPNAS